MSESSTRTSGGMTTRLEYVVHDHLLVMLNVSFGVHDRMADCVEFATLDVLDPLAGLSACYVGDEFVHNFPPSAMPLNTRTANKVKQLLRFVKAVKAENYSTICKNFPAFKRVTGLGVGSTTVDGATVITQPLNTSNGANWLYVELYDSDYAKHADVESYFAVADRARSQMFNLPPVETVDDVQSLLTSNDSVTADACWVTPEYVIIDSPWSVIACSAVNHQLRLVNVEQLKRSSAAPALNAYAEALQNECRAFIDTVTELTGGR